MKKFFRLGSRGNPLSLVQAECVKTGLVTYCRERGDAVDVEIVPIAPEINDIMSCAPNTSGKASVQVTQALLDGHLDAAVHAAKDIPLLLPPQLTIACFIERTDPRDVFISFNARSLMEMPEGSVVGTSLASRVAQILFHRPDMKVVPLNGTFEERMKKLGEGSVEAMVSSSSSLYRLGLTKYITRIFETDELLPERGQGAIGVLVRRDDGEALNYFSRIRHEPTEASMLAERAFSRAFIKRDDVVSACLARLASDDILLLEGLVAQRNGKNLRRVQKSGRVKEAESIGKALAEMMG